MAFFKRLREGLARTRTSLTESMNSLLGRGPEVDDDFWDELEETLILGDFGGRAAIDIVESLRDEATRQALPDASAVLERLTDHIADQFPACEVDPLLSSPSVVLFVGINGAGKTTTVGKLAWDAKKHGRKVLVGNADTFRAAAIEQLDVWGERADVEVISRERGSDPASVCYEVLERAEQLGSDLVLIDTSGRLHTSGDLMRELGKVVGVTRKRSQYPVYVVLVMDATTGQNGITQASEFNRELELDGIIMTKLDGTAKGGIAVAASKEIGVPILRIGVGESIEDLRPFDAHDFARALIGGDDNADDDEDIEDGEDIPAEQETE
jgi:fused signal recognition particle receptor